METGKINFKLDEGMVMTGILQNSVTCAKVLTAQSIVNIVL